VGIVRHAISRLTAVVALSVAACGSSTSGTPAASGTSACPTPTSASNQPKAKAKDHVAGLISSVSANTIQVTQRNGSATVDFANSTKISSLVAAQLSDVTAGSCVAVHPTRDGDASAGTVTAAAVQIVPASNGQCPQPRGGRKLVGAVGSINGTTVALTANGTKDSGGALQAASITVRPAMNGSCPRSRK
jgi:hypothetical protein